MLAHAYAELACMLPLLRHLARQHSVTKTALVNGGLLDSLREAWRCIIAHETLALDALQMIGTVAADNFDARHALCSSGQSPLLLRVLRIAFRCALEAKALSC